MAGVRSVQKEATRTRVLEAAKTLFEASGYDATGIRDIAKNVGMSTGAVFANFKDKASVYRAVYGHAPVSAEMGRAFYLAAQAGGADRLSALVAKVAEA
jgi:AcrR family transcriptional regulator